MVIRLNWKVLAVLAGLILGLVALGESGLASGVIEKLLGLLSLE